MFFRDLQRAQDIFGVDFDFDEFDQYGDEYDEDEDDEEDEEVRENSMIHIVNRQLPSSKLHQMARTASSASFF